MDEKIELLSISTKLDKNLTEMLDEDFVKKLKTKFDNVTAINLVLSIGKKDSPNSIIGLNHLKPLDSENKDIIIDVKANNSNNIIKELLDIL
ncbi:MAG: hypothetical protein LBT66_08105 [Methanobrevibacter sp.]|jgi:hypothetical protein|nr:hypothetical protein [Candidatus Methanovirga meridionalis]